MTFAQILPLAFVMIAGPQIISAFFLATSKDWGKNSIAYIAGAGLSVTTVATLAYLVWPGGRRAPPGVTTRAPSTASFSRCCSHWCCS